MKKLLFFIAFIAISSCTTAQVLSSNITANYSKSVANRVYDVASKVTLTPTEQQSLADLFTDEEDDINDAILNNAPAVTIDSIKANYKSAFNQLLSTQQINDYYNACNSVKVNTTARLMAAMLQYKYNTSTTMQQYFNQIFTWREETIERIWNKNIDTPTRNNNLYNTMVAYDSLLSIYTNAANGGNYFVTRIYYLDSIMPIDTTKRKNLSTTFYNNCINYKNRAYADNFNAAFNTVFNTVADTPYYNFLYFNELIHTASNNANNAIANYIKRDKISVLVAQQLFPIVLQREKITATINKIFPTYTAAKDSIIDTLTYDYQTQINNLIGNSSSLVSASQIDIALHYATQLNLSTEQINNLQQALIDLNKKKEEFKTQNELTEYDSKVFESKTLNNILTADQYTQVLTTKYINTAQSLAKLDWEQAIKNELNNTFNEATTKTELTNYHLAVLIAYYRNAYDKELQYTSVRSIQELMPDILRILIERWEYKIPYSDTPDTFFQW